LSDYYRRRLIPKQRKTTAPMFAVRQLQMQGKNSEPGSRVHSHAAVQHEISGWPISPLTNRMHWDHSHLLARVRRPAALQMIARRMALHNIAQYPKWGK
jgi:hypothetical protein